MTKRKPETRNGPGAGTPRPLNRKPNLPRKDFNMEHNQFPAVCEGQIGNTQIQTVDARELHVFLEIGKKFADWIQSRIQQYGFVENVDFVTFSQNGEKGRPTQEYAISIDMAKELGMVERTDKGRQVRKYFIECERRAKQAQDPIQMLNDPAAMRGILLSYSEKVIALEEKVGQQQPLVEAYERIAVADGSLCITDAAKTIQVRPKELFGFLRSHGWIYSRPGTSDIAYQSKLSSGLLEHKTTTVYRSDGTEKVTTQVRVTPKGLARLAKELPSAVQEVA